MKKAGLITIYHVPNYGSVLQAYATQILLEKFGIDCHIINYKYPNEYHHSQGRPKQSFKSRIGHLLGLLPSHRKSNKLTNFKKKYFKFTRLYKHLDELKKEDWSDYDLFIVGSDQVWKAKYTLGDSTFLLSFVPNDKKRISIASSFASNTIPENFYERYKKYLNKFNAISVRESNGIDIIKKQLKLNIEPKLILDPTLLLSKEEWLKSIPRSNFKKKKKYILLYMLTYAFEPRPYIFEILRYLQQQEDYEIIALEGYTPTEKANGVNMVDKTDSSIPEFIDLFNNADIVVTSSFHGTAFAVNFEIPLISIIPDDDNDDRQTTFLKNIGINGCIAKIGMNVELLQPQYNKIESRNKLEELRNNSYYWLQDNL